LDALSFKKVQVLNKRFHRVTPVRSTLKGVWVWVLLSPEKGQISGARFLQDVGLAPTMHAMHDMMLRGDCSERSHQLDAVL
jgi:hypothetical protein